jgi:hypothetical protein
MNGTSGIVLRSPSPDGQLELYDTYWIRGVTDQNNNNQLASRFVLNSYQVPPV